MDLDGEEPFPFNFISFSVGIGRRFVRHKNARNVKNYHNLRVGLIKTCVLIRAIKITAP